MRTPPISSGSAHVTVDQQRLQRERRVAQPAVAVVPVALAAGKLGQRGCRCRDHSTGRLVRQQFENQGGADHDLPPSSLITAFGDPPLPHGDRLLQSLLPEVLNLGGNLPAILIHVEDKSGGLIRFEDKIGDYASRVRPQLERTDQTEPHAGGMKDDPIGTNIQLVTAAGVIEGRPAFGAEGYLAAHAVDDANNFMASFARSILHGHEIDDLADPGRREKPGHQHIGFGQVHLAILDIFMRRRNFEEAALFVVQQRRENGGRIEFRKTHEINRAVHPHQCHRAEIANHPIILDRLVPGRSIFPSP